MVGAGVVVVDWLVVTGVGVVTSDVAIGAAEAPSSAGGDSTPPIVITTREAPSMAAPRFRLVICKRPMGWATLTKPNTRPATPSRTRNPPIVGEATAVWAVGD